MATIRVETYGPDGTLIDVQDVETPDPSPTQTVQVDPQALTDAQDRITAATTIAGLRSAVAAALDLLNPGT